MLKFLKQSGVYTVGVVISRMTALLLLPLYTRLLSPSDYGVLDILLTIATLSIPIFSLGVNASIQFLFFGPSIKVDDDRSELVMTSLIIVFFSACIAYGLGQILAPTITALTSGKLATSDLRILFADVGITSLLLLALAILRMRQQPLLYNVISVLQLLLMAGLNLYFVAVQNKGVSGIVLGTLLADLVAVSLAVGFVLVHHFRVPKMAYAWELLRLGFPLIPIVFAAWVVSSSDRFFLLNLATLADVGRYGIANRLASGVGIFVAAVQLAWRPYAFSIQTDRQARKTYATVPIYYFILVGMVGLVISASSPLLLRIFATEAYFQSGAVITPLVLSQVVYGSYFLLSTGLEITKRVHYLVWIMGLAAVVNTALNVLLIPFLGALGASLATLAGYAIAATSAGLVSQRVYPLPFNAKQLLSVILVLGMSYAAITLTESKAGPYALLSNAICILLSGIAFVLIIREELLKLLKTLRDRFAARSYTGS